MCLRFKLKVTLLAFAAASGWNACLANLAPPRYIAYEIGTFGGPNSRAIGVNDHGMVVGIADTGRDLEFNAFVYTVQDGVRSLGLLPGSSAIAVNNAGRIVGATAATPSTFEFAYAMDEATRLVQPLWFFPNGTSQANGINEAGHVVGDTLGNFPAIQSFYYRDGVARDIGGLGGIATRAFALSNTGWVAGMSETVSGATRAFLYSEAFGMRDLGTLGGNYSAGRGVNDLGHVVGMASLADDVIGQERAFMHDGETMISLGTLGGPFSAAFDINNDGLVVGTSAGPSYLRAFLHEDGVMLDLSLLADLSGTNFASLSIARDISETGYIVGEGTLTTGATRGFLLVPTAIPEPGNIAVLGGVFAALWTASRRRRRLFGHGEA